jgi:putative aldouronate transport system permease protein
MASTAIRAKNKLHGDSLGFRVFNTSLLVIAAAVTFYPFYQLIILSFNDAIDSIRGGIYFWPRELTLDNYRVVFADPTILRALFISVSRTVVGTVFHLIVTGSFAYALSKHRLIGRKFFTTFMLITMFFNGGLIPTYLVIRSLGLMNNFFVYILPTPFSFNPFNAIIMITFFRGIPADLEDSARIDGANDLVIFARLVVPTSTAVFAVIGLFVGVAHWSSWLDSMLYGGEALKTIQMFLVEIINTAQVDEADARAAFGQMPDVTIESIKTTTMVVTTVPIVLVYPFLQKYFVKGALLGSLKG